jgi:hypothetical protein
VPESFWTGESLFGGAGFLALGDKATATLTVPASDQDRLVMPVLDLVPGSKAVTTWTASGPAGPSAGPKPGPKGAELGKVASGDIGAQGASPAPGALLPVTLPGKLSRTATAIRAAAASSRGDEARVDAVMLEPLVSRYVLGGDGHGSALLRSASTKVEHATVRVPGAGSATVEVYDGTARLLHRSTSRGQNVPVTVAPGGFTLVRR